jgi:maltooligosyltrehalose trehalohydrolase
MHEFSVWAPRARTVEVQLASGRVPLRGEEDGWWRQRVESAGSGTPYSFIVDGGEPLPDPRSAWQPQGIHGPSCLVDHSAFVWADATFQARPLPAAVIYEMHIGTFTPEGTFDAAVSKLDYLADLGITHIELMPVAEFSGQWGWGYDGVDIYAPHHHYGGPEGLKHLVSAAHKRGLAVLLDVVYNHVGPEGNYLSRFGPYFTGRHRTPWGEAVNLDGPHSMEVRRFFIDNALMWFRDYHIDGLRLDAVHMLMDSGAVHFLEQLCVEVEQLGIQLGRHVALIAESDLNDPRIVRPREMGGYGIHAQWSDDFHHALHVVLTGENDGYYSDFSGISDLAKALRDVFVYNGVYSRYRKRLHGRPVRLLPAWHFLGYIQNHDQVGNRARGERLSHLINLRRAKIAAGIVLTAPFVPMLFQGEEWAASSPFQYFTSHEDRALAQAVSAGRRSEFIDFGWMPDDVPDPQDPQTFGRSKLRWDEIGAEPHAGMLEWYRSLLRLRRRHGALADGNLELIQVRHDQDRQWLVYRRGPLTMVCNFARAVQCIPVDDVRHVLLTSASEPELTSCGASVGPETFAILTS